MGLNVSSSSQSPIWSKNAKMAKFTLILLALVAIQGCYGSSFRQPKLNELEQAVKEFAFAMKDINGVILFISKHLSSVARDYEYEINDIFEKHPVYPIIAELRDAINKFESEAAGNSKNCFEAAWTKTVQTTEEMKRGLDICISEARTTGASILSILETIDGRATKVQSDIIDGFKKCMQGGTDEEVAQCLRDLIEPLKEELVSLKKEVNIADEEISKDISDSTRNLNICLQHVRRDVIQESGEIMENLNKCIKVKFVAHPESNENFGKLSSKGFLDFFRQLREKINDIIHIVSHLPNSIEEIPDKINEIISHINISALYSQLKSEVHDIISDGGSNAEKCRPEADERLNDLAKAAEDENKVCMDATEGMVDNVEAEFERLVNDAKQLLVDLNKQIYKCFTDHKVNPIAFGKCLKEHYNTYKDRVSVLQNEVEETVAKTKLEGEELLKNLASCVNKVQLDFVNQGQDLIADVEKCVQNA